MPYSPEDIVAYEFRTRTRGYDRDEVDGFLDALADQVEQQRAQTSALEGRLAALEAEIAEAKESERALKRTLITVQDAADRSLSEAREEVAELRERADREAEELRERTAHEAEAARGEAQAQAREIVAAAERAVSEQRGRIAALQQVDAEHRGRLREHLEAQLEALGALPDPFAALGADLDAPDRASAEHREQDAAAAEGADPGDVAVDAAADAPPPPRADGDADGGLVHDEDEEADPWRLREPVADEPDPPIWS